MKFSQADFKTYLQDHSLIGYFTLAYTLSWLIWVPMALSGNQQETLRMVGGFGPTVAALALSGYVHGWKGLRDLGSALTRWKVGWGWHLIAFLGTPLLAIVALGIHSELGTDQGTLQLLQPWYVAFIAFGYVLFTSVLGEEIGWRGFALPRLQSRYNALMSSLVLAAVWSLWHLPLFFMQGNFHSEIPLFVFFGQGLLVTILLTWFYNNTDGSLLIAHIFHTSTNVTFFMLPVLPSAAGGDLRPMLIMLVLAAIVIAVVLAAYRPATLAGRQGKAGTIWSNNHLTLGNPETKTQNRYQNRKRKRTWL